jgi:CopG family transcriptional regulator/antitoxin EndoAI
MNMARITKTVTLSLPPEMDRKISALMKQEGRTRSELLREALRRYMEEQEWKETLRYGRMRAKEKGITEDQVEDIVDTYRK